MGLLQGAFWPPPGAGCTPISANLRVTSGLPVIRPGALNDAAKHFPSLPDAGTTDRRQNPEKRIRPGQALESAIVRRVLPEYSGGTKTRGAVSVLGS